MVTIIVAIYNPIWVKLRATLISILNQKDIHFEIIIADDGSKCIHKEKIIELFNKHSFTEYSFSILPHNKGTCWNYYSALVLSKYDYVKALSPGDLFYDDFTLTKWYRFAKDNDAEICFGEPVLYEEKTHCIINGVHNPRFLEPYELKRVSLQKKNYLLIPDPILGASIITKRNVAIKNVEKILDHVKYCEDYFIKLHVLNGGKISYFRNNVIWYEYGLGVSTNSQWKSFVKGDKIECAKILINEDICDWRWKMIWKHQIATGDLPKYRMLLFPTIIPYVLKKKTKVFDRRSGDIDNSKLETLFLSEYWGTESDASN